MNAIARVEFELAYYDVAVKHGSHYATGLPQDLFKTNLTFENSVLVHQSFGIQPPEMGEAVCFSLSANAPRKNMNASFLSPTTGMGEQ